MKSRIQKGMLAGLAATVVVSIVDVAASWIQATMGVQPLWFHSFPTLLAAVANEVVGLPNAMWVGWLFHFVSGVLILGSVFGILCPRLPTDTAESKGILFAVGAFVAMGLIIAPMAGVVGERPVGMFFMQAGFGTFAWMIITHAVYGLVLGNVYGRLVGHGKEAHDLIHGVHHHRHGPYHA